MPRYKKRDFQIGKYYLSKQARSPAWCRSYFDPASRQVKRRSLGTTDYQEAKQRLEEWFFLNHNPHQDDPEPRVTIAQCLARYWEHHAKQLASADTAKIGIQRWLDFYGEAAVEDLHDIPNQQQFHKWLMTERGLGWSTAKRVITTGKAAINHAHQRGDIKHIPHILNIKAPKGQKTAPPQGRPLETDEIIQLFEAANTESLRLFMVYALATGARPDAILDLSLSQCDIEHRLINLLPAGREQTTKHRPTVKMPEAIVPLTRALQDTPCKQFIIGMDTAPQKAIRYSWRRARATAGLDNQVNPYSLRHTVGRWLRQQSVDAWEISAQLGHRQKELTITEIYAPYGGSRQCFGAKHEAYF